MAHTQSGIPPWLCLRPYRVLSHPSNRALLCTNLSVLAVIAGQAHRERNCVMTCFCDGEVADASSAEFKLRNWKREQRVVPLGVSSNEPKGDRTATQTNAAVTDKVRTECFAEPQHI
ncbi:hypothetical protein BaRGS_00026136 [Batillaria attramentaria]|uniref:Uncharacterized protein n=1 Tax=Batillaria attramentaria TaxID=370345 RepID=A0ABD0K6B4_9CAEN